MNSLIPCYCKTTFVVSLIFLTDLMKHRSITFSPLKNDTFSSDKFQFSFNLLTFLFVFIEIFATNNNTDSFLESVIKKHKQATSKLLP